MCETRGGRRFSLSGWCDVPPFQKPSTGPPGRTPRPAEPSQLHQDHTQTQDQENYSALVSNSPQLELIRSL